MFEKHLMAFSVLLFLSLGAAAQQFNPFSQTFILTDNEASSFPALDSGSVADGSNAPGAGDKTFKPVTFAITADYIILGGEYNSAQNSKPSFAASVSSSVKIQKFPGHFEITIFPEALAAVGETRREVKNSFQFQQAYKSAARASLAQILGIPVQFVDQLVPPPVIAQAEAQAKMLAGRAIDAQINYDAAWRTALDRVVYKVDLGHKLQLSVGKDYADSTRDLLPDASSLIFGSTPEASAKLTTGNFVTGVRVYHDRGAVESPFGIADSYIQALLKDGGDFFRLTPDSYEFTSEVNAEAVQKISQGIITRLMVGGGERKDNVEGTVRTDFAFKKLTSKNLVQWQATNFEGNLVRYWTIEKVPLTSRFSVGTEFYKSTGRLDGLQRVQPLVDFKVTHFSKLNSDVHTSVKYGYANGPLTRLETKTGGPTHEAIFEVLLIKSNR